MEKEEESGGEEEWRVVCARAQKNEVDTHTHTRIQTQTQTQTQTQQTQTHTLTHTQNGKQQSCEFTVHLLSHHCFSPCTVALTLGQRGLG